MAAGALAACQESSPVGPPPTANAVAEQAPLTAERTSKVPTVRRVDIALSAVAPLRPGRAIQVRAVARANRGTRETRYEFFALDDDSAVVTTVPGRGHSRAAQATYVGAGLARGGTQTFEAAFRFARPGYYRVLARAVTTPDAVADAADRVTAAEDTAVLNTTYEVLHLAVDAQGGRTTVGFDPGVIGLPDRLPYYGSFGPFQTRDPVTGRLVLSDGARAAPSPALPPFEGGLAPLSSSAATADATLGGTLVYNILSCTGTGTGTGCSNFGLGTLPRAHIAADCRDANLVIVRTVTVTTGDDGSFGVLCPDGTVAISGTATLTNAHVTVQGPNGEFRGATFWINAGEQRNILVNSDYAGRAYERVSRYAPQAEMKLGRARNRVVGFRVHDTNPDFGGFYEAGNIDRISLNFTRIFDDMSGVGQQDGTHTILHEYGHAFHWWALAGWRTYDCGPFHNYNTLRTLSCGFVEGFADFFAVWVAGDYLRAGSSAIWASDHVLEQNPFRTLGNGALNEGAVAAFLYDLVDGVNEPDGANGQPDGEESFDGATYPGRYVADLVMWCIMYRWVGGYFGWMPYAAIDGVDEFTYCAERTFDGRQFGQGWRSYGKFSEQATEPPTWNRDVIRRLWRYNLYNVGP